MKKRSEMDKFDKALYDIGIVELEENDKQEQVAKLMLDASLNMDTDPEKANELLMTAVDILCEGVRVQAPIKDDGAYFTINGGQCMPVMIFPGDDAGQVCEGHCQEIAFPILMHVLRSLHLGAIALFTHGMEQPVVCFLDDVVRRYNALH